MLDIYQGSDDNPTSREKQKPKTKGEKMEKLERFARLLEEQTIERLRRDGLGCEGNIINARVTIKPGRKYTKIDAGGAGRYMVDRDGNIFGIKGYGVVHLGHHYGTLDTINEYYWGEYTPIRRKNVTA